jgi:hypothetical protein
MGVPVGLHDVVWGNDVVVTCVSSHFEETSSVKNPHSNLQVKWRQNRFQAKITTARLMNSRFCHRVILVKLSLQPLPPSSLPSQILIFLFIYHSRRRFYIIIYLHRQFHIHHCGNCQMLFSITSNWRYLSNKSHDWIIVQFISALHVYLILIKCLMKENSHHTWYYLCLYCTVLYLL